jgi:uncharacterized protein (TIGR04255 family)
MLSKLKNPPIVEVVCGFVFEELGLDPLLVGQYWSRRRDQYPKREIHPPVRPQPGLTIVEGIGPIRSWFVSVGDETVLQIQPDRFYFNWRRRGDEYPRFGDHDGRQGVLGRALGEFGAFSAYCEAELNVAPQLRIVELAKINLVRYLNGDELGQLIPSIAALRACTITGGPDVNVQIGERSVDTDLLTLISSPVMPDLSAALRVEIRASRNASSPLHLHTAFTEMNENLNGLFEKLFSPAAMDRFREGQG